MESCRFPAPERSSNSDTIPAPISVVASRIDAKALNLEMWELLCGNFWMGYDTIRYVLAKLKSRKVPDPRASSRDGHQPHASKPEISLQAETLESHSHPANQPTSTNKQQTTLGLAKCRTTSPPPLVPERPRPSPKTHTRSSGSLPPQPLLKSAPRTVS